MKPKYSFEPHLVLQEVILPPGQEWKVQSSGWTFMHASAGFGYWLHPQTHQDLSTGSVLVLSEQAQGVLRASQLGELVIRFFKLQPERLTGLVTLGEQRALKNVAAQDPFVARHFPPTAPLSEKFKRICEQGNAATFTLRWSLLELFAEAFGDSLAGLNSGAETGADAKARLAQLLCRLPASELLNLGFSELVRDMGCTPRHLSRVFREVVGMSFREKQAQVRLVRARELLATTESKVVEVALESGYPSLSLFNLVFKRRFGVSPAQWREQAKSRKSTRVAQRSIRVSRL